MKDLSGVRSGRPAKFIYRALADTLRGHILNGVWPVGGIIPNESQLSEQLSASRSTVRKTLEQLVKEGYLERRPGKGTWVIDFQKNEEIWKIEGMGLEYPYPDLISVDIFSAERIPVDPADQLLSLFQGDQMITRIKATRKLAQTPVNMAHIFMRSPDAEKVLSAFDPHQDVHFFRVLERTCGRTVHCVQDTYEAVLAVGETAQRLDVFAGAPLMLATRVATDSSGAILEVVRLFMRTDVQKIKLTRVKSAKTGSSRMAVSTSRVQETQPKH